MAEKDPMRGHNHPPIFTAAEMGRIGAAISALLFVAAGAGVTLNKEHQQALEDFFDKMIDSFS